jgi:hypothetical protein
MGIRGDRVLDTQHIPSGTRKLSISIGGIRCVILCHDTSFIDLLRARYQWFESPGPAVYEILVRLVPIELLTLDNVRLPAHPHIKKVNSSDNYIIKEAGNLFVAVANTFSKKVLVKLWKSKYCFDSFLRILFTLILTDERGLLLHASAVSENGRGSVFFGPSGSGKTTITRLSSGRTILSEEMVIIKPHNGGYRVYGTPFWGDFSPDRSSTRAELDCLYSIKKDQRNSLMLLDKSQAVKNLYQCVPFFSDDGQLQNRIFDTCRTLVDAVPVYELHFLPDPSFWQVLNEHSSRGNERLRSDTRLRHAA